jgi:hypothetical protein
MDFFHIPKGHTKTNAEITLIMQPKEEAMIIDYYQSPAVMARIIEFLGGETLNGATCSYVSPLTNKIGLELPAAYPPKSIKNCKEFVYGISRSVWDRRSLIADMDIEYVNFNFPAEPYLDPLRTFTLLEPVRKAALTTLQNFGIAPLQLITGRGFHFLWTVSQRSLAFEALVGLGCVSRNLESYYRARMYMDGAHVPSPLGRAYAGLGMVIEYLMHRILRDAVGDTKIPIRLTAVASAPAERGREIVSLDMSEYADPLNSRVVQVPFTPYCKSLVQSAIIHEGIRDYIPVMVPVPINGIGVERGIEIMRSLEKARDYAGSARTRIPAMSGPMMAIIGAYRRSSLAMFHRYFYGVEHEPVHRWPSTYDSLDPDTLPPCVGAILTHPNDLLATPAGMQQVVRTLFGLGWHPRHIAGLIRSKFERDYGWGSEWYAYNASLRADVYTRIFSGLIVTEEDTLQDFNCGATKEKGYCFNQTAGCDLQALHQAILERRSI